MHIAIQNQAIVILMIPVIEIIPNEAFKLRKRLTLRLLV